MTYPQLMSADSQGMTRLDAAVQQEVRVTGEEIDLRVGDPVPTLRITRDPLRAELLAFKTRYDELKEYYSTLYRGWRIPVYCAVADLTEERSPYDDKTVYVGSIAIREIHYRRGCYVAFIPDRPLSWMITLD